MPWNSNNVFQILIISGGTGSGIFVYSPSPGLGNLIGSWAGTAGVDAFGNVYPAGFSASQGTFSGQLIAGIISNTPIGNSSITGSDFSQGTIETTLITLDAAGGQVLAYGSVTVVTTFNANGTFTPPAGVTSVSRAQLWGGSGGGHKTGLVFSGGGAGGGGEYAERSNIAVTPLTGYPVTVGAAGAVDGNGGSSVFAGDVVSTTAHGGKAGTGTAGGNGGSGSGAPIHFNGGAGGNGSTTSAHSGGGGSSAGSSSSGTNGGNGTGGADGGGGAAPAGGGSGAAGGTGTAGSIPGGGGGGAATATAAGAGAHGRVIITYQTGATNLIAAIAGVAGADAAGNAFGAGFTGSVTAFHPGSSPTVAETAQPFSFNVANGWVASGRQTCQYYLTPGGAVRIMGSVKVPAGFAVGQAITNAAPAGYRPANTTSLLGHDVTAAPNGPVRLVWTAGGVLQYSSAEGTAVAAADSIDIVPVEVDLVN